MKLHFTLLPRNEFLRTLQGEVSVDEVGVVHFVEIT